MDADELIIACPRPNIKAKRLADGQYVEGENGLEKKCRTCLEYWPADSEFFYSNRNTADGITAICKACYVETRYPKGR